MMLPGHKTPRFVLTVMNGPDEGKSLTIDARALPHGIVGSGATCALELSDPTVARHHARLAMDNDRLSICDVGAEGGVIVNGATIKEAYLRGGERIRLGASTLEVRREAGRDLAGESADEHMLPTSFGAIHGASLAMRRCFATLTRLAALDLAMVLEGEQGTGKELIAREVHRASPRASGPYVELVSADAPTEASVRASIAEAHGGVLFVPRITELSPSLQGILCEQLLWSRSVRLIATSRRSLIEAVLDGKFDHGLALLLGMGHVEIPALRERDGDIGPLAQAFWDERIAEDGSDDDLLPTDFLARYEGYSWPGNVRELYAAVISRHVMGPMGPARLRTTERRSSKDFLDVVVNEDAAFTDARDRVVREFEGRFVARAIALNGSALSAARASGLPLRHFEMVRQRCLVPRRRAG